jgi:transcriptional regulator with XRE-family HTH domain
MDPYERLRELLIRERKRAGFSQAALAAKLGKPQSYVSKCEQGERRMDVLELLEIADALGTDAAALVVELRRTLA